MSSCEYCGEDISDSKKYCDKSCYGADISKSTESTCRECGSQFSHNPSAEGKYCSQECRDNSRRKTVTVRCEVCSDQTERQPNELERVESVYCSRECQIDGQKLSEKCCEYCGDRFRPSYSSQRFCSRACSAQSRKSRQSVKCEMCGTTIVRHDYYVDKYSSFFCSPECRSEWLSENSLFVTDNPRRINGKYGGFGSNWPEWRNKILSRAGGNCENCRKSEQSNERELSVHHKEPRRDFIESDEKCVEDSNNYENLIALCQECHMKAEHNTIDV